MSFSTLYSRALLGVEAREVVVETHLSRGLPGFAIVGLPETAVKEAKERVRSAILNAGLEFPSMRITVNLAPADLPKTGGIYDLAIALGILAASRQVDAARLENCEILGELALNGSVRRLEGIIPAIIAARSSRRKLLLPQDNRHELSLIAYREGHCGASLLEFVDHLVNATPLAGCGTDPAAPAPVADLPPTCQIKGQAQAKRALQIAAAGAHHLLLVGPPGSGKTLLAQNLVAILPQLQESAALELAAVRSASGMSLSPDTWRQPPLRAPHHGTTAPALVGGGGKLCPGEISLAHNGVLFLDELPEFRQSVLDSLREPLESGVMHLSRNSYRVSMPAAFQLIAAMNPCPCGYAGASERQCRCTPQRIQNYLARLSGPLLDRLDLIVEVPGLSQAELLAHDRDETDWRELQRQVSHCRSEQLQCRGMLNGRMTADHIQKHCQLRPTLRQRFIGAVEKLSISARGTHRLLKVARTIADLEGSQAIAQRHLWEAISLRRSSLSGSLPGRL